MRPVRCALCLSACLLLASRPAGAPPRPLAADEDRLRQAKVDPKGESLLAFFRQRAVRVPPQRLRDLTRQLGARSFAARERASKELTSLGGYAIPDLLQAARNGDPEVRRRAEGCLQAIRDRAEPALVMSAARLIAARRPAGAAEALLDFLPAVTDPEAADTVFDALAALAVRDARPDSAVLRGLADDVPLRRAGAAVALCRATFKDKRAVLGRVRPLLRDADPLVRMHAGLALARLGEKEAVPVVIRTFEHLPRNLLWRAEDALYRLAGEHAPSAAFGDDGASRRAFRDAWLAWWDARGKDADLASINKDPHRDHTLVVLLDRNVILDLDADDKEHFKIDNVKFPLDVQPLPGERVLVAEYRAGRVTERLRDGTLLWEARADEPLVAQRLPGGRTFIACKGYLTEIDREGRQVFWHALPDGGQFMRARKLPDGTIAAITQTRRWTQHCVRLDPSGKELARFPVRVSTFGGRLDVQPDGRVLVPHMDEDRVVEYDAGGEKLRTFSVRRPIVAARLPNGNTLITSMIENRAVELDLAGKMVWEYQASSRVTRAFRH